MICVVTHRRLKPGSWEQFRRAWEPENWWPSLARAYHLRSIDDENEVVSFGFFEGTLDEFEAMRDTVEFMAGEQRRLQRIAPFEESTRIGGVYEVFEEIDPRAP
jgi:hypothetical protein